MITVRPATAADAPALAAIYGDACLHGFGTFEEAAPSSDEMARRLAEIQAYGLPYLVAEQAGKVVGLSYAKPFRPRSAYRFTVEDSIYIAPAAKGSGIGKALLSALIPACEALGMRQMVAVIGDSENHGSIGLHRAMGFSPAGAFEAVGFKHGRWVDIVFMQRALNSGRQGPPDAAGLSLSES